MSEGATKLDMWDVQYGRGVCLPMMYCRGSPLTRRLSSRSSVVVDEEDEDEGSCCAAWRNHLSSFVADCFPRWATRSLDSRPISVLISM